MKNPFTRMPKTLMLELEEDEALLEEQFLE
jgi:hypothetical protein